ncbi:unnamed protein product [Penicillium nalgiovense]|nr:unnamed protein product [Penicillium nalgiovense]
MAPSPGKAPSPLYNNPTPLLSHISGESVRYSIMPDDTSKSASIPSWQKPNKTAEESPSPTSDDAPATTASTSRQALLDQASKFLEDESIRDAPTERKVSFLESKGLSSDDIQQVLGISRNDEASTSTPAEDKTQEEIPSTSPTQSQATTSPPATSSSTSNTMPQSLPAPVPTPASRDPLIHTIRRRRPRSKSLRRKRVPRETNDSESNKRTTRARQHSRRKPAKAKREAGEDRIRDPGGVNCTQEQALQLRRRRRRLIDRLGPNRAVPSRCRNADNFRARSGAHCHWPRQLGGLGGLLPSTAVDNHVSRVESITSKLREIVDSEKDASVLDDSMRTRLTELHHYCDGLIYSGPTYSSGSTYGVWNSNTSGSSDSSGLRKAEDEAIAGFRADIRGVKGALLSARNFPASRGGRLGGLPVGGR